jgi:cobalamin synthase
MQHDRHHNQHWTPWSVVVGLGEAIRFLTIIPQPWLPPTHERSALVAIPWFPAAGLVIGGLLCLAGWLAGWFWGSLVAAALIVVSWGVITGGLHLDGLSDTFDAVVSWRSPARKLEIMKDSRVGAMGALALIAVLLLKVALLAGGGPAWWQAALLAPVLGRWAACYGIFFFPAAGETRFPHPPCARAAPSQTLPRAGVWGNPVSPPPCLRAAPSQTLPRAGDGETRFPHPPA